MRSRATRSRNVFFPVSGVVFWLSAFFFTALVSAGLGYLFGQRALLGVSSPVGSTPPPSRIRDPRTVPLLNEAQVIAEAEAILQPPPTPTPTPVVTATPPLPSSRPTPTRTPSLSPELAAAPTPLPTLAAPPSPPPPSPTPSASLPPPAPPQPVAAGGEVSMQVLSVRREGGQVVLNVAIQNNSPEPVRFLYSFLNITDNNGRPIPGLTQGLPGELPPNSQVFQGTIRIPASSLVGSRSLSLSLADYPSRRYRVGVSGIPVPP